MDLPHHRRVVLAAAAAAVVIAVAAVVVITRGGGSTGRTPERGTGTAGAFPGPRLDRPQTITLAPDCSNAWAAATLDPSQDYVVRLPDTPLPCTLAVVGGRRVHIYGGAVAIPDQGDRGRENPAQHYGLLLKNQAVGAYVEGVDLGGPDLGTGVVLDQTLGARVVLRNVRIDEAHGHGYADPAQYDRYHSDCIQSWAGPSELLIDRLTCVTDNFGLQLSPQQYTATDATWLRRVELRHVNIRGARGGRSTLRYQLWRGAPAASLQQHGGWWQTVFRDVWLEPAARGGRSSTWMCMSDEYGTDREDEKSCGLYPPFSQGMPPGGDFVPAGSVGARAAQR